MIPRLPHDWVPDEFPYDLLDSHGIDAKATHDEILAASLRLQSEGTFDTQLRRAWDQLRRPEKRLAVDFFLFAPELARPQDEARTAVDELLAVLSQ